MSNTPVSTARPSGIFVHGTKGSATDRRNTAITTEPKISIQRLASLMVI